MNSYDLSAPLGCFLTEETTQFRLLFPGASSVKCLIFSSWEDSSPEIHPMRLAGDHWELQIDRNLEGFWYQYQAEYKKNRIPKTPYANEPFADPRSKHVTVRNHYRQEAKTLIFEDRYDWQGDSFVPVDDVRDLIIYETHVKDLVAWKGSGTERSGTESRGTYRKWLERGEGSIIAYLKELGVNAVEFLPLQKFPATEPPYGVKTEEGFHNTWNRYACNYWGYMTSFYFAPETSYASDAAEGSDGIHGRSLLAVHELKDLIRELHRNGIAVIMDVVYNHSSLFDVNPLCHHMPDLYLRKDADGNWMNRSGTGNEMRTEHPAMRGLMVDSLTYWMKEYHIDGFRFDLAGLIDEASWNIIREELQSIHPNPLLIAEPWGGRYVPWLFSNHGWSSWNDRFRNGIKGSNPHDDRGFIFSGWHHGSNREQLENWLQGTLRDLEGGLFQENSHSVNYLESHDGFTLGDFIRISERYHGENPVVEDISTHTRLTSKETEIAMLGAFCLMVTPGISMIHAGQEFARTKVIADFRASEGETGHMDHNSYNKDDATNWIALEDSRQNRDLYRYYCGLIRLRKESPALRKANPADFRFDPWQNPLHVGYRIDGGTSGDLYDYYVAINAARDEQMEVHLPSGLWELLVDRDLVSEHPLGFSSGKVELPPQKAILFRKLRH